MSDCRDYTVGWICALPTELTAALAFFDEHHDRLAESSHDDANHYELGRIGPHQVVVAVLPKSEYGLVSAATVAKNMTRTFPNIRFGLMVGVGGGAPSKKHDIRLGDIVVSTRSDGRGGVVQYDFGPREQNGGLRKTGSLNQPPQALLTAVGGLESRYELEGHQLVASVEAALDRRPRLRKKYARPGQNTDRLYHPQVIHPAGLDECGDHCGANPANLVDRLPRCEDEDDPAIHYGLIGSGSSVIKDAVLRDEIVAEESVLCFEMEAAGLMNHFPCLVIRGICDYCDSHKNKQWQGFAAMMAAAYAKDLLLRVSSLQVQQEKLMSEAIASVSHQVDRVYQTTLANNILTSTISQDLSKRRVVLWLSAPDPSSNVNHARSLRHQGTGAWLLEHPVFQEWLLGSRQSLWLRGLSGSGKTVLSTTVLDRLEQNSNDVTLRFFFDFNDTSKQGLDGVLRSFALQLYQASCDARTYLDAAFRSHQDGFVQPGTNALSETVCQMLASRNRVWILIDALDESSARNKVVRWFREIANRPELSHVLFFCTSRPEPESLEAMPKLMGENNCLAVDQQAVDADIGAFVAAELQHRDDFLRMNLSKDLLTHIQHQIGIKAKGMFRWAACQLDTLAKCLSPAGVKAALQDLPRDLGETYHRMIRGIPDDLKADSIRLLQFLVFSERPLTLSEANDVIATRIDGPFPGFSPDNRVFQEVDILKYCPGLAVNTRIVDYEDERYEIHLAHSSVQEFLQRQHFCIPGAASAAITRTCLNYLHDVEDTAFPFARFAAEAWTKHATKADISESLNNQLITFLRNEVTFQRSLRLYQPDRSWDTDPPLPSGSRLYYACISGLVAVARDLLSDEIDVNVQGGQYGNALQAASLDGDIDIVRLLVDRGADVNAQGGHFGNALEAASVEGHMDIVRLLVDRGADVNAQDGQYGNALQGASFRGHMDIVRLLVDRGANVDAQGGEYGNALQTASFDGDIDIVRLLVDRGADVNAQGGLYGNALQAASFDGDIDIVRLLVDRGADVNAQGGEYGNALQAASFRGHIDVVRLLRQSGCGGTGI